MRLRRRYLVALALGLGVAAEPDREPAHAAGSAAPPVAPAELVVLATPHDEGARVTEVRSVPLPAGRAGSRLLGAISHPPGAVVRGDLSGPTPVVVADEEGAADRDFGAALYRVDAAGTRRLVGGVGHARRPLASADGLVYVERGVSGPMPASQGQGGRIDALEIGAVDPATGAIRAVYTYDGYALHLAGEHGGELVVYRVSPSGADLVLVERASGRSRLLASIVPMARDFSMDRPRSALVYVNRDARDTRTWAVERVDLVTGLVTRLASARDDAPAPYALPGGETVWTAAGRQGLASQHGEWLAPLGPGFDAVRASSRDGAWLAVLHVSEGAMDELAVVHLTNLAKGGVTQPRMGGAGVVGGGGVVRLGGGERVEPIGFVGGDGSAR